MDSIRIDKYNRKCLVNKWIVALGVVLCIYLNLLNGVKQNIRKHNR